MKKTFLLLAALLLMGGSMFAQNFDFCIGPKVGYQAAKLSYKQADIEDGFANHFTIGVFGRVEFGKLYVQPEILYFKTSNVFDLDLEQTGSSNFLNIPTGAEVNLTLNAMNLQVPVLVGYEIFDIGLVSLRAQVGPTANFVLQSKTLVDYQIGQQTGEQELPEETDFDTKSISWGLQAGLGVDILNKITLDINYNFVLSKIFEPLNNTSLGNYFDFSNIDNTKQNLFMVTLGFKFL